MIGRWRRRALSAALFLVPAAVSATEPLRLDLPLACIPGLDCFIQNYPDMDPTRTASDHACGGMTYDGHTGTDFRIPDMPAMKRGVAVKAAAAGTVAQVRDGIADTIGADAALSPAHDDTCGNSVLIDHGEGWSTQYCHLRKGSLLVKPGDIVTSGAALAQVGMSGGAGYPQLHFTVRKGETVLDPFTRLSLGTGCGADGASLWTDATTYALGYRAAAVLNAGFAPQAVESSEIESGRFAGFELTADSPALVFYGRALGLVAGDVEIVEIRGPRGELLIGHSGRPLNKAMPEKVMFAGRKVPKSGWERGTYTGIYRILRSGQIVSEAVKTITYR